MMGLFKYILVAFLFAAPLYKCAIELDGDVLVLDDSNFEEAKSLHKMILLEFYAPWCGHCKTLAPEYAKAATAFKKIDPSVKIAKIDATEAKDLAQQFAVQGFPTLKFLKNGATVDYDGGRTEKDIVNWLKKKTGPAYTVIKTVAELTKLQSSNDAVTVGVFAKDDSPEAKQFMEFTSASKHEQAFVITSSAEVRKHLDAKDDSIVVVKDFVFNDNKSVFKDFSKAETDVVEKFVGMATTPMIQEFTQEKANKIFGSDVKKHVLIFTDAKQTYHDKTIEAVKEAAHLHRGTALFVTIPTDNKGILDYFGLTQAECPKIIIADMTTGMKKFPLEGEITTTSINAHVDAFLAGELKPVLKSEEPLPEDTAGNVKIVKGKSFMDIVIDNDKDVLFEIYAPWCGHCKKLEPIYEEVAAEFKGNDKIVLAKMDGTANEIDYPGLEASGFPSLFFLAAGSKDKPIPYQGQREKADLIKLINDRATSLGGGRGSDEL